MAKVLISRLQQSVIALWGILTLVFITLHLGPDPVTLLVPPDVASSEAIEAIRERMGLNDPLYIQYGRFVYQSLQGNFGSSIYQSIPAMELVLERIPRSLYLVSVTMLLAVIVGIFFGIVTAVYRYSFVSSPALLLALFGQSVAPFWLGIILMLIFSIQLGWLPPTGSADFRSVILPAATLSTYPAAQITRLLRSNMLEVLNEDYIRVAIAKGLAPRTVVLKHAMQNALIPTVTVMGIQFGRLFGASIVVETVFAWPGIGRLMYLSITTRDFPVVLASTFVLGCIVLATNLAVDVLYTFLDPRVRFE